MSHPFDLYCKKHPERLIDDEFRPDRLCRECGLQAQNAGYRYADAHWADTPAPSQLERAPDGRIIGSEHPHGISHTRMDRK